jgi:rod shape determining protein RodA
MKRIFIEIDWLLFIPVIILSIIGLAVIGSLTPNLFSHQLFYLITGLILFLIFGNIDFRIFERLKTIIYVLGIFFLATPLIFGQITRGAIRWLEIGPFKLQPSELIKPFMVIFFAGYFINQGKINARSFIISLSLLFIPVFLIFIQPDLGSSLVVAFSWLGILLATDITVKSMVFYLSPFLLSLPIMWRFLKDYQKQRILSFINPLKDPMGSGYNLMQAMIAAGSGQFFGRGLGRGTQSHLKFLPEYFTDFIFASLCEELGFVGAIATLLLFGVILWRILVIGRKAGNLGMLICVGIFSYLFIQIVINIGMNLGILPITGIPLPLISYGGSSIITTMISLGIVGNISKLKKEPFSGIMSFK